MLLLPVVVILVFTFIPSVRERMLAGFGEGDGPAGEEENMSEITSGRSAIWPHVIDKIKESPIIGYGRIAMVRTGLYEWLLVELGEEFRHPHNAYLEMLLDNGLVGFFCVMPFYALIFFRTTGLFLDRDDHLFEAAGGVALALLLALLIGSLGAQTLYPREGVVGMWAAIGIALRVWVERERMADGEESGMATEGAEDEDSEYADENSDDESIPSPAT